MADRGIAGQPPAPERLRPYYDQMPDVARFYARPTPDVSSVGKGWVEGHGDETPRPMPQYPSLQEQGGLGLPSNVLEQLARMGQQGGARLTAAGRRALPASKFALGKGHYPVDTPGRARAALSRGSANASPAQYAKIKAKVHREYPGIKQQAGARLPEARLSWEGQYGARHSDEAQDRKLIMSLLHKHGLLDDQVGARGDMGGGLAGAPPIPNLVGDQSNLWSPLAQGLSQWKQRKPDVDASSVAMPQAGARYHDNGLNEPGWFRMPAHHTTIAITLKPRERERQAGARMPTTHPPHMHALRMASATHLKNLGDITPAQHASIHADALSKLKAHKAKKPAQISLPAPPSFGSLAPPPMPGPMGAMANVPTGMGPPPMPPVEMPPQAGARYKYPKYGAGHYLSTPTPVSSGSSMGAGQSGASAGARRYW